MNYFKSLKNKKCLLGFDIDEVLQNIKTKLYFFKYYVSLAHNFNFFFISFKDNNYK